MDCGYYVTFTELDRRFQCPICLLAFRCLVQTACGHRFCNACITRTIPTDHGRTWNNWTSHVDNQIFRKDDGLQRNPHNPKKTLDMVLCTLPHHSGLCTQSLRNHLFPNNTVHDFFKVESVRRVYLASQMAEGKSIHAVITYNRGAEWKPVQQPDNVECKNSEKEAVTCKSTTPTASIEGLMHGLHSVRTRLMGLCWFMVLHGPHAYEMADSGGLLVAVPLDTDYPKVVKFSTDEGNCWHDYKFTADEIKFTGLLTEPRGKSMTIGLWG